MKNVFHIQGYPGKFAPAKEKLSMRQCGEGQEQVNLQTEIDVSKEEEGGVREIGPAPFFTLTWQN